MTTPGATATTGRDRMTTRRAQWARRVVRHTPEVLLEWPVEAFAAASGVLSVILAAAVDFHFATVGIISHAVGEPWALVWSGLTLVSALTVVYGLCRDDLRGVIVGLRILGLLYLTYLTVAVIDPGEPPLSVAGAAILIATGVTAVFRSVYLSLAIRYAERR